MRFMIFAFLIFSSFQASGFNEEKKLIKRDFNLTKDHVPQELILSFENSALKANLGPLEVVKNILFKLKKTSKYSDSIEVSNAISKHQIYTLKFKSAANRKELLEIARTLHHDKRIKSVEANQRIHLIQAIGQSPFKETPQGSEIDTYNLKLINTELAWKTSEGSNKILVSILDTGVAWDHKELSDAMSINQGEVGIDANGNDKSNNGIDDDLNGYIDDVRGWDFHNNDNSPYDDHGHGTHCAGIIGASHQFPEIKGVAKKVSLLPLKFLDDQGGGDLDNAITAIYYSIARGSVISSNSWGGGEFSPATHEALELAREKGHLYIFAAGNNSRDSDRNDTYPSNYDLDNIISVAATDKNDALASFSNYGSESVDLAAPGVDIWSSVLENDVKKMSGTSMATPHVTGVAVLMMSKYPNWNYTQVRSRIEKSVDRYPHLLKTVRSGGRLNAASAIEEDKKRPSVVEEVFVQKLGLSSASVQWREVGDDSDEGKASFYEVRVSHKPFLSEFDWKISSKVGQQNIDFPSQNNSKELLTVLVPGLPINGSYYIAIRAMDNVGNLSPINPGKLITLPKVSEVYSAGLLSNMDSMTLNGDWKIIGAGINDFYFTNSNGPKYRSNLNDSAVFGPITISSNSVLTFDSNYWLEANYDYGFVEYSLDDQKTWNSLMIVTDRIEEWENFNLEIPYESNFEGRVYFRFRTTSDHSIEFEGWKIKNVALHQQVERR